MIAGSETISVYGILFGETGDWTLGQINEAFVRIPDRDLIHGMGLAAILGFAFHQALGDHDRRTQQLVGSMGPLGHELERRGHDPMRFNYEAIFDDWRASMAANGADAAAIPTHRLSTMRSTVQAALARLASDNPGNDVRKPLDQVLSIVDAILRKRGVVADDRPQVGLQA